MAGRRRPGARLLAACAAVMLAAGSAAAAAEEDIVIKKLERTVRGEERRGAKNAETRRCPSKRARVPPSHPPLVLIPTSIEPPQPPNTTKQQQPTNQPNTKQISLKTPIVTVSDALEARAAGKAPPSRFLLCYSRALADRLAYLELEVDGKAQGGWSRLPDAEVDALGGAGAAAGCFAVPLDAAAGKALASASTKLDAYASFARALAPRPAAVAQGEPQHVLFADAALRAVSPYRVEGQAVEALTPAGVKPLSFSPSSGALKASSSGGVIKFSPTGATAPWAALSAKVRVEDGAGGKSGDGGDDGDDDDASASTGPVALSVHFPLDEPLVRGLRVVREVEVSHWGNVYFEETYLVRNDGPTVEGEFSRRRYSDRSAFLGHMFENLRARLPPGSRWIYFRDAIGNVSTSAVHRLPKGAHLSAGEKNGRRGAASANSAEGAVVVDLGVRYPMLGGWQADFVLGYSLPLSAAVSRVSAGGGSGAGGRMRLRIALPPPIEGMYADDLEVRVVLPEGARDVAHSAPTAPNAAASLERKSTYLDAPWGPGRPVLALRLPNAVPDHAAARLTVEYTIGALDLLRKPFLLVAAFGGVFAALALYNRADFSIVVNHDASPSKGGGGGRNGGAAQKAKAA